MSRVPHSSTSALSPLPTYRLPVAALGHLPVLRAVGLVLLGRARHHRHHHHLPGLPEATPYSRRGADMTSSRWVARWGSIDDDGRLAMARSPSLTCGCAWRRCSSPPPPSCLVMNNHHYRRAIEAPTHQDAAMPHTISQNCTSQPGPCLPPSDHDALPLVCLGPVRPRWW